MPNNLYNGQKFTKLVAANITATTKNVMPSVPEMYPRVYNAAITAASTSRMILSVFPIFFFIQQSKAETENLEVTWVTFGYH